MKDNDICINNENAKFNFRVAAIFRYKNKVLIQKSEKDNFYGLIGGRVKLDEKTIEALKREIKEEVDFDVKEENCKLLRVCENFFSYNFKKFHELLFIYCVEIEDEENIEKQDFVCFDKTTTKMCWFKQEKIQDIDIRPKEIKEALLSNKLEHIVIDD